MSSFAKPVPQQPHLPHIRPIGIFWDIENCKVPFNRSVVILVERIRKFIFGKHFKESEFLVVCDTHKTNNYLLDDLNTSNVTVIHVNSTAKNAADDKLKQQITRFIDSSGHQSALLVLTDDINFACVLCDLRNRFRVEVILIQRQASTALKACADTVIDFGFFCEDLPPRFDSELKETKVLVRDLPKHRKQVDLKRYLSRLSANCGGKRITLNQSEGEATIQFSCFSDAKRAQQRIDGQDVFGYKIVASLLTEEPTEALTYNPCDKSPTPEIPNEDYFETTDLNTTEPNLTTDPNLTNMDSASRHRTRNHSNPSHDFHLNELMPFCDIHTTHRSKHWTNGDSFLAYKSGLPMVNITISLLATRLHHLLDTHAGAIPLNSFIDCYVSEYNELFNTSDQPLINLEHLITCVPGVCISTPPSNCLKRITWIPNRDKHLLDESINSEPITASRVDSSFGTHLGHFGKEVRELLKSRAHTTIPFNKFVPAYHTHFVRQLCVSQFGCYKLWDLLEEIPHIVQVYGENDQRMITLTHREQTKRFATDLVKVLKAQNGRRIKLSEFPAAYHSVFNKPFDVSDYGVCYFADILRDVWEGTVIITPFGTSDRWIEIPKRERSSEQIRRTVFFAQEVIEMLSQSQEIIDFTCDFSKFIPCYHRFFNKQCRVTDYGFTKLMELFEELSPKTIEIESNPEFGERQLRLSYDNRLKALIYRFETILKSFQSRSVTLKAFEVEYKRKYKTKVDFYDYYANDLIDLVDKMPANKFRITQTQSETKIILLDRDHFKSIAKRMAKLLMEESTAELPQTQLQAMYLETTGQTLDINVFRGEYLDFEDIFILNRVLKTIRLSELFLFARSCIQTMQKNRKKKWWSLDELERQLMRNYDRPLPQPTAYKCRSFVELFAKLLDFFRVEKRKSGKYLLLIALDLSFIKCPLEVKDPVYQILKRPTQQLSQGKDLMSDSEMPETLPLPDLVPSCAQVASDLIVLSSEDSNSESTEVSADLMEFNEEVTTAATDVDVQQSYTKDRELAINRLLSQLSIKRSRIAANFS